MGKILKSNKKAIKRFQTLIYSLEKLRMQYGFQYEDKCQKKIKLIGEKILNENLLEKQEDIVFSQQLLMMNCVPEKYWK